MLAVGFSLLVASCGGRAARAGTDGPPATTTIPPALSPSIARPSTPIDPIDRFARFDHRPHHRTGGYPDLITCPPAALPCK